MMKKFIKTLLKSMDVSFAFRKMYREYCSYGIYLGSFLIGACYFLLVSTIRSEDVFKLTFAAIFLV